MDTFSDTGEGGRLDQALTAAAIILWIAVTYYAAVRIVPVDLPTLSESQFGIVFLGLVLGVYVVKELGSTVPDGDLIHTSLLSISGIIVLGMTTYMAVNYRGLLDTRGTASSLEYTFAALFVLAMIYLTWRAFGTTFLAIIVVGIAYGYFGPYVPGVMGHGGLSYNRILLTLVINIEGFFGFLTRLTATWIALFLLFAGLLQGYGAFDLIFRLAARTARYIESGVAQTAVIGSAIIGSLNGSQTANAGMTGSFTIPLMQRNGIRGETAGGIESTASTMGQVLPPVMGAAAFIMASLLGISYLDVLIAGLVPAIILLISVAVAVHFASIKEIDQSKSTDLVDETLPRWKVALDTLKFGVPILVLVWALGIAQYTVPTAAMYTVFAMMLCGFLFPLIESGKETRRMDVEQVGEHSKTWGRETIDGFRHGAIVTAPVAIILAAINGVVDIFTLTGVPSRISLALIDLSGGELIVALLLCAIICIVLGLGMPTTASYTIVALLIAPTLTNQFFVDEIAAHYFVFYAALLAGLTPPIATCPAVTAGIANANFWRTCYQSLKISAPLFVLPFTFVYHPVILASELSVGLFVATAIILFGSLSLIYGINVPLQYRNMPEFGVRSIYVLAGIFVMVYPSQILQLTAIGIVAGLYALQTMYLNDLFTKSEPIDSPVGE